MVDSAIPFSLTGRGGTERPPWSGRRVAVTGAGGFIGSHLVEALVRSGATVKALCRYNSSGSWGWLDTLDGELQKPLDVRLGDVRDSDVVRELCRDVGVVFHLAALIGIPYSYEAPRSYIDTNVVGTLNVLEAARAGGCERIVHVSTSEVYGTPECVPIDEGHPLRAQSPYAASKAAADKMCEAYFYSFCTPVVVLRPFNTYGPRQSTRAVIPTIMAQALTGAHSIELGDVRPRRDFTYVDDTVSGFLLAGSIPGIEGQTIQLGTGRAIAIGDLVELIGRLLGVSLTVKTRSERLRPSTSEVEHLESSPRRALEMLGWRAEVPLEDGLLRAADWVRSNLTLFRRSGYHR